MTSPNKRLFFGGTLAFNGTTLNILVDGIKGNSTKDVGDTTVLNDTYKTYLPGQIDPGDVTITCCYDPTGTDFLALSDAYRANTIGTWLITFPTSPTDSGSRTESFSGFIKEFGRTFEKNDLMTTDVVVQISGDPGHTH